VNKPIGGTTRWEAKGTTVWGRTPFGATAKLLEAVGHSPSNGVDGVAVARAAAALPDVIAQLEAFTNFADEWFTDGVPEDWRGRIACANAVLDKAKGGAA
jgi:hypothetical protein